MDPLLLENAVSNWLWSNAIDLLKRSRKEQWPDFELSTPKGERLLLEIKNRSPAPGILSMLANRLRQFPRDEGARFLLLTPEAPDRRAATAFAGAFRDSPIKAEWLPLSALPGILGKPSPGPWESPQTWSALQTAATLKGMEAYRNAPIGSAADDPSVPTSESAALARQIPFKTLALLAARPGSLEDRLGLGSRRANVTIVLSDLVNFSSLVTASRPDDLKEAMSEYYRRARKEVFENGGMLDKFIGDAVLAVFGYPDDLPSPSLRAIEFAQDLIVIGREVLEEWQQQLTAVIPTGTRIGIATGDIWPINIGDGVIELSFLGDTINLAARLEKNSGVDRFLLCNRTHTAARAANPTFIDGLSLSQIIIPTADAKGQAFPTRAWTQATP